MFCKACGQEISDDAKFCSNCGTPVEDTAPASQPVYTDPAYQGPNETPHAEDPAKNNEAGSILTMGILAVAFAGTILSFVGIIFGAIGLSKANKFANEYGTFTGKARTGKYLSLGGLIGGSVVTVCFFIFIFVFLVIVGAAVAYTH